jgi:hypothetical protein
MVKKITPLVKMKTKNVVKVITVLSSHLALIFMANAKFDFEVTEIYYSDLDSTQGSISIFDKSDLARVVIQW